MPLSASPALAVARSTRVELATQKYHSANKAAGKVTTALNHYSTVLEKVLSLVNWSIPNNTRMVVGLLGVLCLVTLVVPWDYIALVLKVQLGVKIFLTGECDAGLGRARADWAGLASSARHSVSETRLALRRRDCSPCSCALASRPGSDR